MEVCRLDQLQVTAAIDDVEVLGNVQEVVDLEGHVGRRDLGPLREGISLDDQVAGDIETFADHHGAGQNVGGISHEYVKVLEPVVCNGVPVQLEGLAGQGNVIGDRVP